jgi:hypothetical protein
MKPLTHINVPTAKMLQHTEVETLITLSFEAICYNGFFCSVRNSSINIP